MVINKRVNREFKTSIGLNGWLLVVWIFSFPLRNISIFGNTSLDNLLVPVLIGLWAVGVVLKGDKIRWNVFVPLLIIYLIGSGLDHRVFQGGIEFRDALWSLCRDAGYFLVPLLLINTLDRARYVNATIMYICAAGTVSALMVSLGILELEYVRMEESRIGIDMLPKATGVFTNFGDVALLASYSTVCLLAYKGNDLPFGFASKKVKVLLVMCIAMGVVGTQSRNLLVSIFIAFLSFKYMTFLARSAPAKRPMNFILTFTGLFIVIAFAAFFIQEISSLLSNMGGGRALNTAEARVGSYQRASEMLSEALLTGISYANPNDAALAERMHNIWIGLFLRGGLVNVLCNAFIIIYIMRGVFLLLKYDNENKEAIIVGSFISSMLISTMFFPGGSIIYWFMLGVCLVTQVRRRVWIDKLRLSQR
jgi:hypothetical protein